VELEVEALGFAVEDLVVAGLVREEVVVEGLAGADGV
jgi:hypothetical protein